MNKDILLLLNKIDEIFKNNNNLLLRLNKLCIVLSEIFKEDNHIHIGINLGEETLLCKKHQKLLPIIKISFREKKSNTKGNFYIFHDKNIKFRNFLQQYIRELKTLNIIAEQIAQKYDFEIENLRPIKNDSELEIKIMEISRRERKLKQFIYKNYYERDIFHDLMPFKVKEILLIATLYDAYTIESEGNFTQQVAGEFSKFNLTSIPRVTAVISYQEAYEEMKKKHFDMIIIMVGIDKKTPVQICKKLKKDFPYIPIFYLLNNNAYIKEFEKYKLNGEVDNIFVWNGDSRIFFTMIKLLEDRINLDNDTKIGHTRIIMLIEDSIRYYSRYLPELYMNVFKQTQRVIEDVTTLDELYKVLRLRARPKILLTHSYEEAKRLLEKYKPYFLGIITDVEFYLNGEKTNKAGRYFILYVKKLFKPKDFPIVVQSSDYKNIKLANELGCSFIYKNSDTLAEDIKQIIQFKMGFGDFIYKKNDKGDPLPCPDNPNKYCRARTLDEFEQMLYIIPDETLRYHASKNHFSLWLIARGEIKLADDLAKKTLEDFNNNISAIREYLIKKIKQIKYEKNKGKIVEFREEELENESNIVSLAPGALGGKGRGIAFIHSLIYKYDISSYTKMHIKTPYTFIIGTDEYDEFLERNNLKTFAIEETDFKLIRQRFLEAELSDSLMERLYKIVKRIRKPLAVRSSGLFEDSLMQPFAGIFETYIVPNSLNDIDTRVHQLANAIKMVYASVFSPKAKHYITAINYKIEEEKMAIVIQKVIGNQYEHYYYPHISGVAQSYNYYPFSYIKPEDGYATIALGLGVYVVEGEKAFKFCPKYPKLQNQTIEDLYNNSQTYFYAVDLNSKNLDFIEQGENVSIAKLDIWDAERHGTLKHLASVYNPDTKTLSPGLDKPGPRVLDFADILKYDYIPLADTISEMLEIAQEAMGSPVEIEFAVDLNKDNNGIATFYLLQIKPLLGSLEDFNINFDKIDKNRIILKTNISMGNGKISDITDIVFVKPETFDKSKTLEIAKEIEQINKRFITENKNYVLIGPGRWGTRDRWIGIPVAWTQISKAKVIVEISLPGFPLDSSAGSHFFHNVVAMNIGYFTVHHNNKEHLIRWDILNSQQVIYESEYIKHIRFPKPLIIKMDGKKRIGIIIK